MNERKQNLEELKVLAKIEDLYKHLGKTIFSFYLQEKLNFSNPLLVFVMSEFRKDLDGFEEKLSKLKAGKNEK